MFYLSFEEEKNSFKMESFERLNNRKLQVHMEGQEPRVCQEEIVLHPEPVDQHEEKKFKSL